MTAPVGKPRKTVIVVVRVEQELAEKFSTLSARWGLSNSEALRSAMEGWIMEHSP